MKTLLVSISVLFLIASSWNYAQETSFQKLVIVPLNSIGIEPAYVQTAESILRMEINRISTLDIISERRTREVMEDDYCDDTECAMEIGKTLNADQVLLCNLNALGDKIIVQYNLLEIPSGKRIVTDQTTALNVEDLEAVMKRVAVSVVSKQSFNKNVEVGSVVGKESVESLRRAAKYNFGLGFGYLFPTNGYDEDKKSFTINVYFDYEITDYAVGLMLGARKGVAMNIYGNYLFSKTDVCPYVGAALGFHWVTSHKNDVVYYFPYYTEPVKKDEDGIELGLEAGIRLFHTYNFQIFIKGEYIMTFNDYNDKAFVFTIGIL
ncbi:MAG: hypothetical protein R6W68_16295 [Ignavibacteriaceae bacterium]